MRLIDADALRERMYHDAFETDSDMQKWDGGCWIRYKMFEIAIEEAPTVQPEILQCKDCKYYAYGECHYSIGRKVGRRLHDFCSRAERR